MVRCPNARFRRGRVKPGHDEEARLFAVQPTHKKIQVFVIKRYLAT